MSRLPDYTRIDLATGESVPSAAAAPIQSMAVLTVVGTDVRGQGLGLSIE